jgi:ankyrin repeat protein
LVLQHTDALSIATKAAIANGEVSALADLLEATPGLAHWRVVDQKGAGRTLLHIATDWPGHFPGVAATIKLLIECGADPSAAMSGGQHQETPLHWAASSNDVAAIDALLDGGADLERPGAIFTNGPAMSDAVIFAQWDAARRLLERGAKTNLTQSAALGLMDRLNLFFETPAMPPPDQVTAALWHACRGGQLEAVQFLIEHGADLNWVGWDRMTPLDGARQSGNEKLIAWLVGQGARPAND